MSGFVAHLNCPLCPWGSVSSAPTYVEAEKRVTAELLEHLDAQHPEANQLQDRDETPAKLPAAG